MQEEARHELWLRCMQMPNCSEEEAMLFSGKAAQYLNERITPTGQTVLMIASSVGSYHLVRGCLLNGANPIMKDSAGRTALHYAAAVGSLRVFEELVNRGTNPLEKTIGGETPLAKACIFCQGDIIQWYLNNQIQAFQVEDCCGKKPLQMLKLSGQGLYDEVKQIYAELTQQMDAEN